MQKNRRHLEREKLTITKMIGIYCRGNGHSTTSLCDGCGNLLHYVQDRIEACPYHNAPKPACGLCKGNCFTPEMHRVFRQIMRFSGPRMMMRHPLLTLAHLFDAIAGRKTLP